MECQCRLRTRLVGDGCEVCNSQLAIDLIAEERIELLNLKYAIGGWTEEEAARFAELNTAMNRLSPRVTPEMLAALEKLTPNGGGQAAADGGRACTEMLGAVRPGED